MMKLTRIIARVSGINRKAIADLWLNLRVAGILILSVLFLIALAWAIMGFPSKLLPIESY